MRIVGIALCIFLGLLVVLSVAGILTAIVLPSISRTVAMPAEVVPGSSVPGPVMTHTVVPAGSVRLALGLLPLCLIVLLVVGGITLVVRLTRSDNKSGFRENPEEIRMMQEIHQGLSGLERRVESLETLLLDRAVPRDYGSAGRTFK